MTASGVPVISQLALSLVRSRSETSGQRRVDSAAGQQTAAIVGMNAMAVISVPATRLAAAASARSGNAGLTVMETVAGVASSPVALVAVTV